MDIFLKILPVITVIVPIGLPFILNNLSKKIENLEKMSSIQFENEKHKRKVEKIIDSQLDKIQIQVERKINSGNLAAVIVFTILTAILTLVAINIQNIWLKVASIILTIVLMTFTLVGTSTIFNPEKEK